MADWNRTGYIQFAEGKKWLRIKAIDENGDEGVWDECVSEWEQIMDLSNGLCYYRHKKGISKNVKDDPNPNY